MRTPVFCQGIRLQASGYRLEPQSGGLLSAGTSTQELEVETRGLAKEECDTLAFLEFEAKREWFDGKRGLMYLNRHIDRTRSYDPLSPLVAPVLFSPQAVDPAIEGRAFGADRGDVDYRSGTFGRGCISHTTASTHPDGCGHNRAQGKPLHKSPRELGPTLEHTSLCTQSLPVYQIKDD